MAKIDNLNTHITLNLTSTPAAVLLRIYLYISVIQPFQMETFELQIFVKFNENISNGILTPSPDH